MIHVSKNLVNSGYSRTIKVMYIGVFWSYLQVPKGLKTQDAVLPLYQACLLGHKDTAEILMKSGTSGLDPEKKVRYNIICYSMC